jgi:iron complex transport system ATP-binding protein
LERVVSGLRARDLVLALGGRRVLDGVTLDVRGGEWLALVGPNGAGKSSLLALLAGLRAPDAGQVLLDGRALAEWPARARAVRIAWLAQQGEAEGDLPVQHLVGLGRLPRHGLLGAPDADDAEAVAAAMAETEATPFAGRRLATLSGGERQRSLLARALAVQPAVLLLDEPSTHLDPPHQRLLLGTLASRARAGAAVVAVLHDLNAALAADRVCVLDRGRLVADGAPHEPALRAALVAVFGGAFGIQAVTLPGANAPRWVCVPHVG